MCQYTGNERPEKIKNAGACYSHEYINTNCGCIADVRNQALKSNLLHGEESINVKHVDGVVQRNEMIQQTCRHTTDDIQA